MSSGTLIFLLLGTAVVAIYILQPLLRGGRQQEVFDAERLAEARTLESRQNMLVTALRDLEDDLAGDKIDQQDYDNLYARLTRETLEVMSELDELQAQHEEAYKQKTRTIPHPNTPSA